MQLSKVQLSILSKRHTDLGPPFEEELRRRDQLRQAFHTAVGQFFKELDALRLTSIASDAEVALRSNCGPHKRSTSKQILQRCAKLRRKAREMQRTKEKKEEGASLASYASEARQIRELGFTPEQVDDTALLDLLQAARGSIEVVRIHTRTSPPSPFT